MKTTKRLLGIVLALAMLLTMASFPAFAADEGYTYTPKDIVLEASTLGNNGSSNASEPRYIARPSDYNIFVGDRLVLPEGGLALKASVTNNMNGVKPDAFVIDVFQDYNDLLHGQDATLGKTRFFFKIDYSASTNGTLTGIYPTIADMQAGTNKIDAIPLNAEGLWCVGMIYTVSGGEMVRYNSGEVYYNMPNHNGSNYLFSFEVQAAPTSADYQVSAPAVPAGITASDIKASISETAPSGTGNFMYAKVPFKRSVTVGDTTKEELYINSVKLYQTSSNITGALVSFNLDFEAPAYVGTITLNNDWENFYRYEVYGSLDGNSWYPLNLAGDNGTSYNANKFVVNGIAKYFKIVIRDMKTGWGNIRLMSINTATGVLNVLEGNTVTVTGDATGTFTTDVNGKVDLSAVLAACPAGEYLYYIDSKNVTNKIADYVFTGATTVTVEKYVAPVGPVVTFIGDNGTVEAPATAQGVYEVPAEYKGNYSFYADANFKTKFDVTVPVDKDTTVYVKSFQWKHTAKTVAFQLREGTDSSLAFNNLDNSPLILPARTTLYVGDTIVIPHEVYKDLTAGYADAVEIKNLTVVIYGRGRTSTESTSVEDWTNWEKTDPTYTFSKPGYYTILIDKVMYTKADGTTGRSSASEKPYICAFEVKEKPTTAPTATPVPSYNGAEGEVTALLADNFNTSVAFKKSFGAGNAYTEGILAIDNAFGNVNGNTHPVMHALYFQFNLDALSYVDNISIGAKDYNDGTCYPIHEYDAYGSTNNKDWYLLNSGFDNDGVYNVQGVAKYVRIVPRTADGWYAKINTYSVNGYAISEDAVSATSNPTWFKDGEKLELASEDDIPVAYTSGDKTYAITGWKVDTGSGLDDVSLALIAERNFKELGTLVPVVTEVPVNVASLTGTLAPAGQDIVDGKTFSGKYINGFYVEGTQIRVPEGIGETAIAGGLRFVNILDNALIAELDELRTAGTVLSYEYGTLAMASTKYTGGDLVIGYNTYCKKVPGERIFASAEDFDNAYFKYTVCVTGITEANYTKDVMVRPYITINMADGSSVTLYGEQYQTSLYAAAKEAIRVGGLEPDQETHIQSIIDFVE